MADQTFVDPVTGLPLGAHAFGVVSAGTVSAEFEAEHRNRWGFTGAGHFQTAYILYTSTNGGLTWATDSTEFTLQVLEALNPGNDPLFLGQETAAVPTSRLDVAPLRSGCGYKLGIKFAPSLRTGAAQETINWKLGVLYNETYRTIGLIPDAPTGILTGLGDVTVTEWVVAPGVTNDTDKVTVSGGGRYVHLGRYLFVPEGDVALDQNDGAPAALAAGQEYIAVLSLGAAGTVTTTKGVKATAGSAVQPAMPAGELPLAVVRVPYGGVIATSTLLATTGRCLVADTTGLVVSVGPGRAVMPGMLVSPGGSQTLTLPDNTTSTVYLSAAGVANVTAGIPLATVVTSGGDISSVTDARHILRGTPIRLKAPGDEAVASNLDWAYIPYPWTIDRGHLSCGPAAAGASGNTDVAVKMGGDAVLTIGLTEGETAGEMNVETPSGTAGRLFLEIGGITTGGTRAANFEVLVWVVQTA